MKHYDLIVIGGGPGGYESAALAGRRGLKTLLIEKNSLGGVCLNAGCIPTKSLLASAHLYSKIKQNGSYLGVNFSGLGFDYPKIVARKNRVVQRLRKGVEQLLQQSGVEVLAGEAQLYPDRLVKVNDQELQGDKIIIATGSAPREWVGLPFDGQKILNSTQLLEQQTLPEKLAIVGAGVIGLEFAELFSGLGVAVSLVDIVPELLPGVDREAVKLLQDKLVKNGCQFFLGQKIAKLEPGTITLADAKKIEAAQIVITAGRQFNSGLLQDNRIKLGSRQEIIVNETCETSVPGVFAIGDVNGQALYAHAATAQGFRVVEQICSSPVASGTLSAIPAVIYTSPQLAYVGNVSGAGQTIKTTYFNQLGRAQTENNTEGFLKYYLNSHSGVIEGVLIVQDQSEALIGEAIILVNKKIALRELEHLIHPHPAWSEIFSSGLKE